MTSFYGLVFQVAIRVRFRSLEFAAVIRIWISSDGVDVVLNQSNTHSESRKTKPNENKKEMVKLGNT